MHKGGHGRVWGGLIGGGVVGSVGCWVLGFNIGKQAPSHRYPATATQLQTPSYRSPATGAQPQAPSHRHPATGTQPQMAIVKIDGRIINEGGVAGPLRPERNDSDFCISKKKSPIIMIFLLFFSNSMITRPSSTRTHDINKKNPGITFLHVRRAAPALRTLIYDVRHRSG